MKVTVNSCARRSFNTSEVSSKLLSGGRCFVLADEPRLQNRMSDYEEAGQILEGIDLVWWPTILRSLP